MEDLCPSCAMRDVPDDSQTGFCDRCDRKRVSEEYVEKDRQAADKRREQWRDRSPQQREWDRLRQQRHRLLERVKPREPAPEMPDPLRLAEEAINALERIRLSVKSANALELLERTEEIVRRLGWGPDDQPAKPEPERDRSGWDGSWRHVG